MGEHTPSLQAFLAELQQSGGAGPGRAPPPVERWNPPDCGDAGIEILADGTWRHEGARMTRESLVRLFASILRKDADGVTYLVTPVEKVRVRVEDAPFTAVRADRLGQGEAQKIVLTTNVGDQVVIGPERPLRVEIGLDGAPRPYALVRGRLEARILRAPFYEIVDWAEARPDGRLRLTSDGAAFDLGAL
ncbi:MAG: DUF1285 domain-containing protein [Caulobacterales bacterium]